MRSTTPAADVVERVEVTYTCSSGHRFVRAFAADVQAPTSWDCPHCGKIVMQGSTPLPNSTRNMNKTHWDMVLERRNMDELILMLTHEIQSLRSLRK